jgi:hypothetical protein
MAPIAARHGPRHLKGSPTSGEVAAWATGLERMHARIAPHFARREPRARALAYLRGLLVRIPTNSSSDSGVIRPPIPI